MESSLDEQTPIADCQSFHESFSKYLFYVPGAIWSSGDVAIKKTERGPFLEDTDIPFEKAKYKKGIYKKVILVTVEYNKWSHPYMTEMYGECHVCSWTGKASFLEEVTFDFNQQSHLQSK